jgi:hypothetical protein
MSYPEVLDLTGKVQLQDGHSLPSACGGYADVYRASCGGREVAVKVIRAAPGKDAETLQRVRTIGSSSSWMTTHHLDLQKLRREMTLWSMIEHQHVLPFFGFCRSVGNISPSRDAMCFVSPWMAHGEARCYLEEHPDANRLHIVISYLSCSSIHD